MAIPAKGESKKKKDQMSIFNAVAIAVAESIELEVVLNTALDKVMEAFDVHAGGIYLIDEKSDRLVLKADRGLTAAFLAEKTDIAPGTGCAGWAIDHNEVFSAFGRPEAGYICEDAERLMGIDCLVASPIATKHKVEGVLELFAPVSRRLTADEAYLMKLISDQIGVAVENARLFEESRENIIKLTELKQKLAAANKRLQAHLAQEVHIAEMLQKSLLPRRIPQVPGFQIAARLISASEAADVGGDFYDFIDFNDGQIAIVVGDVCGSGIEAATMTSMAKNTIRAFALENRNVKSVLERANRVIFEQTDPTKFVAIFIGILDLQTRHIDYCVAGQPLPLIGKTNRQVVELQPGSMALGIIKDVDYPANSYNLQAGDTLLVFTDGLVEARREGVLFGEKSVRTMLADKANLPLDHLVDYILKAAKDFGGGRLRDDVALVSLRTSELPSATT